MALKDIIARFGFQVDDRELKKADKSVSAVTSKLNDAAALVTGAVIYDKVRDFATEMVNLGDEIGDTAEQIGISTGDLQRWRFVAESCGASSDQLGTAFKILAKNAVELTKGGTGAVEMFGDIGLKAKDLEGDLDNPSALLLKVGLAISKLPTQNQRAAAAMKILGKSGGALVPMFNKGEAGLQAFNDKFDDLGGGLGEDAVEVLGDADQSMRELDVSTRRLKGSIATALAPTMLGLTRSATEGVKSFSEMAEKSDILETGVTVLGGAAAAAALKMAAPYALFAVAGGAAILVWEDLFAMLQGKDSLFGRFFAWVDDASAAQTVLKDIADGWKDLRKEIDEAEKSGRSALDVVKDKGAKTVRDARVTDLKKQIAQLDELERSGAGFSWSQDPITGAREVWKGEMGALGELGIGGDAEFAKRGTMSEADRKKAFAETRAWLEAGIDEINPTLKGGAFANAVKNAKAGSGLGALEAAAPMAAFATSLRVNAEERANAPGNAATAASGISGVGAFGSIVSPLALAQLQQMVATKQGPATVNVPQTINNNFNISGTDAGETAGQVRDAQISVSRASIEAARQGLTTLPK